MQHVIIFREITIAHAIGFLAVAIVVGLPLYFTYLKGHRGLALLAWLFAVTIGAIIFYDRGGQGYRFPFGSTSPPDRFLWLLSGCFLFFFLFPFVLRLYFKWIQGEMTPEVPFVAEAVSGAFHIRGPEVAHGLGWAVMGLAVLIATLPWLATGLDAVSQHRITLLCLGLGLAMLVFLVMQNPRYVSGGLVLCLVGYVLAFMGALQERRILA